MALRTATTAKTASDANRVSPDVSGLAISAIDASIDTAATAGEYMIRESFEANVSSGSITVKQSDDSYVGIEAVVHALKENGYRASYNKRTDDGDYRLCLAVAWD